MTTGKTAIRKAWTTVRGAVAASLEEAGYWLFAFLRLPPSQWKSARTTNAIERLHEEFKRRIKTETVLPSAETAAMLFWALLASGQTTMRKVNGWQTLSQEACCPPSPLTSPRNRPNYHPAGDTPLSQFPHKSRRHRLPYREPYR